MNKPESNVRAWLEKAEHDLLNIENNLAAVRVPWDTVCFHAQQAAEKTLKAFLVHHGGHVPRTHDLVTLLTGCVAFAPDLADLEADCRNLTYFAVSTRYPDDLYEPEEADGRAMNEAARRVRQRILAVLSID